MATIKRKRVLVEVNLTLKGESDVGNEHAYFMYWQITRGELAKLATPPATETHIPIPHAAVVETLVETLSHRHIGVVGEEFAVSSDAMRRPLPICASFIRTLSFVTSTLPWLGGGPYFFKKP